MATGHLEGGDAGAVVEDALLGPPAVNHIPDKSKQQACIYIQEKRVRILKR